jgi:hypothetical protein
MSEMGDLKFTTAGDYMMVEKFTIHKAHKMAEWLESQTTEWAMDLVENHFGCPVGELTLEQIREVGDQCVAMFDYDNMLSLGVRNVITMWEDENDQEFEL